MKMRCDVYKLCKEKDTWVCTENCPCYLKQIGIQPKQGDGGATNTETQKLNRT